MKQIILILSIIALIISIAWFFASSGTNRYEPSIVFIMGVVGIITQFFIPNKSRVPSSNNNKTGDQNVNVEVNVNTDKLEESKAAENNIVSGSSNSSRSTKKEELERMKLVTNILFIDDDPKFKVVKILKDSGWKKTKSVLDIKSVDEDKVAIAQIYFVDINGVGKILECKDEGLDIALMLKQKYPNKKIIIYSANSKNNIFHEAWEFCDYKLEKNALPYQFQKLVEQYSLELNSSNEFHSIK